MSALQPLELADGAAVLANAKAVRERLWPKPHPVRKPEAPSIDIEPEPVLSAEAITPPEIVIEIEVPNPIEPESSIVEVKSVDARSSIFTAPIEELRGPIRVADIQKAIIEEFHIDVIDFFSHRRTRAIVRPRQIAMALCKRLTLKSLPDLGRRFGGRDHTTILHGVRKYQWLVDKVAAEIPTDAGPEQWARAMHEYLLADLNAEKQAMKASVRDSRRRWWAKNDKNCHIARKLGVPIARVRAMKEEAK